MAPAHDELARASALAEHLTDVARTALKLARLLQVSADEATALEARLLAEFERRPEGLRANDLHALSGRDRTRHRQVVAVLDGLEERGVVVRTKDRATGGRPATVFRLATAHRRAS